MPTVRIAGHLTRFTEGVLERHMDLTEHTAQALEHIEKLLAEPRSDEAREEPQR